VKIHTSAVETIAKTVPALALKTFVGRGHKNADGSLVTPPLLVIYPADGIDSQERLTGPSSTQHPRFTLHIAGTSYSQVAEVTGLLKAKFIAVDGYGIPPVIAGWVTSDVSWNAPIPIQEDTDVTPSVLYQVIELSFDADPV